MRKFLQKFWYAFYSDDLNAESDQNQWVLTYRWSTDFGDNWNSVQTTSFVSDDDLPDEADAPMSFVDMEQQGLMCLKFDRVYSEYSSYYQIEWERIPLNGSVL